MAPLIQDLPLLKTALDGSEWRHVENTRIVVFVPSGKIDRDSVRHALALLDEIMEHHADDPAWFLLVDQRKLSGLSRHVQEEMTQRLRAIPTNRMNYCGTLMTSTLANRLLGVFLTALSRMAGRHIVMRSFFDEQEALAWLEQQYRYAAA
jgi:hypothetical protein